MNKLKLARRAMLPAAAAIAAVGLGASAALAQTDSTYTITADSAPDGTTVDYTATSDLVTFSDIEAGITMTCTSSTATGSLVTGPQPGRTDLATITSIDWGGCTGLGVDLTVSDPNVPWGVNGDGSVTNGTQTSGYISKAGDQDLTAHVEDTLGGSLCSFDVVGKASGHFDNNGPVLSVTEDGDATDGAGLIIKNPGGLVCGGALVDGDHATYDAEYGVNANDPSLDPIGITNN